MQIAKRVRANRGDNYSFWLSRAAASSIRPDVGALVATLLRLAVRGVL